MVESSLRLTAGGDRGLLDGERGRFPARDVDIAVPQLCTLLRGKTVHRDDALMKQRVPKSSSFNFHLTSKTHPGVVSVFEKVLPGGEIDNNS